MIRAAGEVELRLVVTLANTPALALYDSLGFVVQEWEAWNHDRCLGLHSPGA